MRAIWGHWYKNLIVENKSKVICMYVCWAVLQQLSTFSSGTTAMIKYPSKKQVQQRAMRFRTISEYIYLWIEKNGFFLYIYNVLRKLMRANKWIWAYSTPKTFSSVFSKRCFQLQLFSPTRFITTKHLVFCLLMTFSFFSFNRSFSPLI